MATVLCRDPSHALDAAEDGEGTRSEHGVLQDGRDVLVAGLDQGDRLVDGEHHCSGAIVVLQVLANGQILEPTLSKHYFLARYCDNGSVSLGWNKTQRLSIAK
jgi:hypothetical protein